MTVFLGNHRVRERILADAKKDALPHAVLLSGPTGTGKFSFLQTLAEEILLKPVSQFFPPEVMIVDDLYQEGKTKDCNLLSKKTFFNQSHRKKMKKKSDTIGVEDLEVFTRHLFETVEGSYKIVLIRDIERMTREASHKFLKMVEEPPQKTLFLMTSSSEKKLLPTFLSRVRREYFSLVSEGIVDQFIYNDPSLENFSREEKTQLADIAAGRGEFLQKMIADTDLFRLQLERKKSSEHILHLTPLEKMAYAEDLSKKTLPEVFEILQFLEHFLRKKLRKMLLSQQGETTLLQKMIDEIVLARRYISQNGNKRMLLESLFLSFSDL